MTSLRSWFVSLAIVAAFVASRPAQAQTQSSTGSSLLDGRATVHFNVGAQTGSGDLSQTFTPLIYDEPATINVAQTVDTGALIDIGGSYMVHGDFGVGLSYTHTSGDGDAAITGQIPHPLVADQPRSASATATGLNHSENAAHISALYRFAATPKVDVTVGLGPTFFSVSQDLVPTVDVTEGPSGPVITPRVVEGSDSAVGVNISADVTYMVTDMIGAGVLLRYAKSTAEVSADGSQSVDVDAGGFQFGVGVRVRF
jgi:outer membrane protein with beta-barrel domain